MEKERWLHIKGLENRFLISDHGRLKSINGKYTKKYPNGYISEGTIDSLGYRVVTLRNVSVNYRYRMHTLVATYFCEKIDSSKRFVNHKDGNKLNNHYSNLEWVTPKENCDHALLNGLINNKGENHGMSKMTEQKVIEIRELYKSGLTHQKIADKFGICRRQVGDIVNRVNWGWL